MLKEFEPLVQQFLRTGVPSAGVSVVIEFAQWEVFGCAQAARIEYGGVSVAL